jgi:hypothetical protein
MPIKTIIRPMIINVLPSMTSHIPVFLLF